MAEKTAIEWADATLNFAWGCDKVSEGCEKCYMFRLSNRFGKSTDFAPRKIDYVIRDIKKLPKDAIVFTNSMTDTFHKELEYHTIFTWMKMMENEPSHQWIVLTKRINRALEYSQKFSVPGNVWIGTSIENKKNLHRLNTLKKIDAQIKFISFEPLLEDIGDVDLTGIDWCIVGGESDFSAPRPFEEDWARNLREICKRDGVAFFYKQSGGKRKQQIGEHSVWGTNILDGQKYLEMPEKHNLRTKESTLLKQEPLNNAQTKLLT